MAKIEIEAKLSTNRIEIISQKRLKFIFGRGNVSESNYIAFTAHFFPEFFVIFQYEKIKLTLTRPIALPPHVPVGQKIADKR